MEEMLQSNGSAIPSVHSLDEMSLEVTERDENAFKNLYKNTR